MKNSNIIAVHEHELKPEANIRLYEKEVAQVLESLAIPGLLKAYHLKGFKGERKNRYAIIWIFENKDVLVQNFGTPENRKLPKDWFYYENEVLAKYLDRHPDTIDFTDYAILKLIDNSQ